MAKKSLWAEFIHSLKNPLAEELIDLVVYRPLAFVFIKITAPLPLTPNQVSAMAMAAGIAAGWFLAGGRPRDFVIGGLLFGLSNALDCADGMVARLRKNGTTTGRIVDGLVDYVTSIAVYIGLGIGLTRAMQAGLLHFPCNAWFLVFAAGLSAIVHAVASDKYRHTFLRQYAGQTAPDDDERVVFSEERARLEKCSGHFFDKTLVRIYLWYLSLQSRKTRLPAAAPSAVSGTDAVLWNIIGPSTHITFFILAALLYRPSIFFIFTIGAANVWMICLFLASKINRPVCS
jgi:phosphatidylglycerophosphate synthase